MFLKRHLPLLLIGVIGTFKLAAQKDTLFWFVAPSVAQGVNNYDRPVVFRISTYEQPATVIVSQPANPAFPTQILNIPAESTTSLNLNPFFNHVENTPPDIILKKGFQIESTAPVSVYYEVIGDCACNPDIFSLKGTNALGLEFYVPFQTSLPNTNNIFNPLPSGSFDIVAIENNTTVTITPTQALVGRPANIPYSVPLQKGETYSGQAASQAAAQHPSGTHISSNKPIAVTMKDDLLEGFIIWGSTCKDLIGDQLVPVTKVGQQYVITKGQLNGNEFAYVVATHDNTELFLDGAPVTILDKGEAFTLVITPGSHFIESTFPTYLLQMTGIGCEISAALLPSIECSGSSSIRFVRTTDETFYLFLVVRSGAEDAFTLNGNPQAVPANLFQPVPGSNGAWMAGRFEMDQLYVPAGLPMKLSNSKDVFHAGILNGSASVTGTRFGFFSDFNNLKKIDTVASLCRSDTVYFRGRTITTPGLYLDTVQAANGCDTVYQLKVVNEGFVKTNSTIIACQGDTVTLGDLLITSATTIYDTINSNELCDTILEYQISFLPPTQTNIDIGLCAGSFFSFNGTDYYAPDIIRDTLTSFYGCDSVVVYNLMLTSSITRSLNIDFCPGDSVFYNGNIIKDPTTIIDTLPGLQGCDTLLTITLQPLPYSMIQRTLTLCPGQSVTIGGVRYTAPGIAMDTISGIGDDCDSIRTTTLLFVPPAPPFLPADTFLCPGETLRISSPFESAFWNGQAASNPFELSETGIYIVTGRTPEGCLASDTLRVRNCCDGQNLYVPNAFSPNDDGFNDYFRAYPGSEWCQQYVLRIYDRWGELVYEADTPPLGWDGVFRGREMPGCIYIWVIEIYSEKTARTEILKGDLLLVR